jgi:hypothetical protein
MLHFSTHGARNLGVFRPTETGELMGERAGGCSRGLRGVASQVSPDLRALGTRETRASHEQARAAIRAHDTRGERDLSGAAESPGRQQDCDSGAAAPGAAWTFGSARVRAAPFWPALVTRRHDAPSHPRHGAISPVCSPSCERGPSLKSAADRAPRPRRPANPRVGSALGKRPPEREPGAGHAGAARGRSPKSRERAGRRAEGLGGRGPRRGPCLTSQLPGPQAGWHAEPPLGLAPGQANDFGDYPSAIRARIRCARSRARRPSSPGTVGRVRSRTAPTKASI